MEPATATHAIIGANAARRLGERLDGKPCLVMFPVRVRTSASKYVYPDLAVVCGKLVTTDDRAETIVNPKVIVEILSPRTEGYDYHRKFRTPDL